MQSRVRSMLGFIGAVAFAGCAFEHLQASSGQNVSAPSGFVTAPALGESPLTNAAGDSPEMPAHGATVVSETRDSDERSELAGLSGPALWARWNAINGDAYELDTIDRFIELGSKRIQCDDEVMVPYSGTSLRYYGQVLVNPAFRERLVRFEEVVNEVGTEVYGRPPRNVRHFGAYSCRRSRTRSHRLSEHALGNAIDIVGFDFNGVTKKQAIPDDLPRQLRGPFQVRVAKHWNSEKNIAVVHARFLRTLTDRLLERSDIFRIHLGPSHRGHHDHFHFDMSPWRYEHL